MRKSLLLRWHLNLKEYSGSDSDPDPAPLVRPDFEFAAIDTWKSRLTCSTNAMNSGEVQTRGSSALGGTAMSASKGTCSCKLKLSDRAGKVVYNQRTNNIAAAIWT